MTTARKARTAAPDSPRLATIAARATPAPVLAGATECMTKPVDLDHLLTLTGTWVGR